MELLGRLARLEHLGRGAAHHLGFVRRECHAQWRRATAELAAPERACQQQRVEQRLERERELTDWLGLSLGMGTGSASGLGLGLGLNPVGSS